MKKLLVLILAVFCIDACKSSDSDTEGVVGWSVYLGALKAQREDRIYYIYKGKNGLLGNVAERVCRFNDYTLEFPTPDLGHVNYSKLTATYAFTRSTTVKYSDPKIKIGSGNYRSLNSDEKVNLPADKTTNGVTTKYQQTITRQSNGSLLYTEDSINEDGTTNRISTIEFISGSSQTEQFCKRLEEILDDCGKFEVTEKAKRTTQLINNSNIPTLHTVYYSKFTNETMQVDTSQYNDLYHSFVTASVSSSYASINNYSSTSPLFTKDVRSSETYPITYIGIPTVNESRTLLNYEFTKASN